MFTGIVEEIGTIQRMEAGKHSGVLTVGCRTVLENTRVGDSIAVNGVCLTVTGLGSSYFTADVMPETVFRSSLAQAKPGSAVNLERAMPAEGRFGGHIVSGHIDGTGVVTAVREDENAVWFTISTSAKLLRYIVEKGSVALDGTSLTVADVSEKDLQVSLIPHTREATVFGQRKPGDTVNIECDILAKYIEKLMRPQQSGISEEREGITMEFLGKYGF
jgi:riboflavin synthase